LHVDPGTTVVTGQRIETAAGRPVAVWQSPSSLSWLDSDPQGTSEVAEDFVTGAITTRYFDPFGQARGTAPAWPEPDRGFLNKPTDPFSGLSTLGAREYAPSLGRFLSVDPQLDTGDPQSLNGYGYGDNNPVNLSDADGQCVKIDSASSPCLSATRSATPRYNNGQISGFVDDRGHAVGGAGCGSSCGDEFSTSRPMNNFQAAHWNGGPGDESPSYAHVALHPHHSCGILGCTISHAVHKAVHLASDTTTAQLHGLEQAGSYVGHHWRGAIQTLAFAGCVFVSAGGCFALATVAYGISDISGRHGLRNFAIDELGAAGGFGVAKLGGRAFGQYAGGDSGATIFVRNTGRHSAQLYDWPLARAWGGFNLWVNNGQSAVTGLIHQWLH
jgi:RHS repeat-associated protein